MRAHAELGGLGMCARVAVFCSVFEAEHLQVAVDLDVYVVAGGSEMA